MSHKYVAVRGPSKLLINEQKVRDLKLQLVGH